MRRCRSQRGRWQPCVLLFCFILTPILYSSSKAQTSQDDEVVRVNTDLIVLNVTVVDASGKYVTGLRSSDFKLLIDNREQPISNFTSEETPYAAAILLDTSGSMENRMTLARSAAIRFLDKLREDDVAAVYRFDSVIEKVQDFSPSRDLGDFAFGIRAKGMTALNDAILRAADDLTERRERRHAIVVLSDGADTKSFASASKALEHALAANATIYTVDMSSTDGAASRNLTNAAVLRDFASKSGGRYVASAGGPLLRQAFEEIAQELSNQYTLSFSHPETMRDGKFHKLEVKLARPNLTVRTRKGYRAPKN